MARFKEFGDKYKKTYIMQEVILSGVTYFMEKDGTVHEKKTDFPVVTDETTIKAVQETASKEEGGWSV
jgi:hypothetical protein